MTIKPLNVLGLMSGASLDRVRLALVSTDGVDIYDVLEQREVLFPEDLRDDIRAVYGQKVSDEKYRAQIEKVEIQTTDFFIQLIEETLAEKEKRIDLIGLEGPSICHEPENQLTYQLGKGRDIVTRVGIKTITHFHNADILNGGLGQPIFASYYNALAQDLGKPVLFINLGGITDLTWIGHYGEIYAFDCGPGNAVIDDWMLKHSGVLMDYNGKAAALGKVDEKIVAQMMKQPFFAKYPPKFAAHNAFNDKVEHLEGLSIQDGAATVTAFVAESIAYTVALYLPEIPAQAILCGGGCQNPTLARFIRQKLKDMHIETLSSHDAGLVIDTAQAVAYLAARRVYGLPITFPTTTGVPTPMTGGEIYEKE